MVVPLKNKQRQKIQALKKGNQRGAFHSGLLFYPPPTPNISNWKSLTSNKYILEEVAEFQLLCGLSMQHYCKTICFVLCCAVLIIWSASRGVGTLRRSCSRIDES